MGHFCSSVNDWQDMTYSDCWIQHGGPVLQPPLSPDLTLLEFYPLRQSQGAGVLRRSDYTNGLCCWST
ncbi:uncharacterized protein TNCV_3190181 [Trichonephila clavipes]|nr:uncharacterized protein TNCV_3190181 [Trichonephila clavipes]